jgi:hypothetical protein
MIRDLLETDNADNAGYRPKSHLRITEICYRCLKVLLSLFLSLSLYSFCYENEG